MKTYAIIPSGGSGSRTGQSIPKQYLKFSGKELIAFTLEVFQNNPYVDAIIIAAQKEYFSLFDKIKKQNNITKLTHVIEGGDSRQASVKNAFESIQANKDDLIAVHDAARPLLPQEVLTNAIISAKSFDSVVTAIHAQDTLLEGDEKVSGYLDRDKIFYAQTPQVFRFSLLKDAYKIAAQNNFLGTDESMVVKNAGYDIKIVDGSSLNFKVTTPNDIEMFESLVARRT